jgi:hypothetical protein
MKKLIMLAMVLGLVVVGTARGEGAWVLWENQFTLITLGHWDWTIIGAYPSYDLCTLAEARICEERLLEKKSQCRLSDGGHERVIEIGNSGRAFEVKIEWKCLPESVDPRK